MNLEAKKREFAAKLLLEPAFHTATMEYDQTALEIERESIQQDLNDPNIDHFERLFLMHGMDEILEASLDIPHQSTTQHFNVVVDSLGFEQVGYYPDSYRTEPSATSIFARPDGLIIVSDSVAGKINGSELSFQWVSNIQRTGDDHPGSGVGGDFEKLPDGRWAYFGYYYPNNGAGLRPWLNSLINRGKLLSPMQTAESGSQSIRLLSGIDKSTRRKLAKNDDKELQKALNIIEQQRFEQFPLWVQEMIGPAIQNRLNLSL